MLSSSTSVYVRLISASATWLFLAPLHPEVLQPKWQNVDHDIQNMHAYLSSHVLADEEEVKRKTVAEAQYFSLCDCVLYKWFPTRFKTKSISNRYVFHDVLASFHDTNADIGHLRVDKVLSALRKCYC
jgi:hypothetical protein